MYTDIYIYIYILIDVRECVPGNGEEAEDEHVEGGGGVQDVEGVHDAERRVDPHDPRWPASGWR